MKIPCAFTKVMPAPIAKGRDDGTVSVKAGFEPTSVSYTEREANGMRAEEQSKRILPGPRCVSTSQHGRDSIWAEETEKTNSNHG